MRKGDKVSVNYPINEHRSERRHGIAECVSRFGWVAIRFERYVVCFWQGEVSG